MKRTAKAAHRELEGESARLTGCYCAAIDAMSAAARYGDKKGFEVCFNSEDLRATALSLYIRRREEKTSRDHGKAS